MSDLQPELKNLVSAAANSSGQPLRVLQIHNFYQQPGGEDIVVRHEAELLRQAGVDVYTWYLSSAELGSRLSFAKKIQLAWQQCWNRSAAADLKRRLAEQPVDLIHVHNVFPLLSPAILHAAKQAGTPVVMTIHNFRWCHPAACISELSEVRRSLWSYVGKALYRRSRLLTLLQLLTIAVHRFLGTYQRVDLFISPSEFVKKALLLAGFSADKVVVKPHSTAAVRQTEAKLQSLKSVTPAYVLYVGRADNAKGLGFLLALWQQLPALQHLQLKVAGVSETEAQSLFGPQQPGQVQFFGFVDAEALAQLYAGAQLLLVPSLVAETFGNVVIEAFSYGTPCLVSDAGALPELVSARHNTALSPSNEHADVAAVETLGAVFRAGDGADFVAKLSGLLQQPALLSQMGQAAYHRYLQYYQPEMNQQALLACYQQALNKQGRSEVVNVDRQQVDVVGCLIDVSDVSSAARKVVSLAQHECQGYVCLANVHMCMTAKDDIAFAAVLRQASLVVADGRPVYWAQRLLGAKSARQVRGVDLMLELCKQAETTGLKIGFYGGQDESLLAQLQQQLLSMFPRLQIVYAWAPPFRPLTEQEDALQRQAIINSGADMLLVGLGCPKQEFWMAEHQQLPVVMLGVGAAFDFIAGRKKQAHRLFQRLGLEWLHRLFSEPVRLSGRYLRHNPRFILGFTLQWLRSLLVKSAN